MNVFERSTQLYEVYPKFTLEHHIFDNQRVREFTESVRLLQDTVGFEDDEIVAQLSLLRYWYSNCPLSTNAQMYRDHALTSKILSDLELGRIEHNILPDAVSSSVALLESIWTSPENPLLEKVYEIVDENWGVNVCLLIRQRNWCDAVQEQVNFDGFTNITVVAPTDVPQLEAQDLLVTVGSHHRFPDHVFTAPRSNKVAVISFAWQGALRSLDSSFIDSQTEQLVKGVRIESSPGVTPSSIPANSIEPEDSYLEARIKSHYAQTDNDRLVTVPGKLARLYGDYSVFLDGSGDKENLIIDPELDGDLRKAQIQHIRPGMFVVLRSDTGDDHIEQAADIILGEDATAFRKSLREWKAKLRIKVRELGQDRASKILQDMDLKHATENNIRNWCSNRSIATRMKSDFAILMEFLDLKPETESLWAAAKAVRDAHLSAGMRISKQLKLMIREHDSETLGQQGRIDFEHPTFGGARLSAFQIESISPASTQVSESNLLRLLDPLEG